jgi:AraC-like DNA-binding protein
MAETKNELAKMILRFTSEDGLHSTPIPGVQFIKKSQPFRHEKQHWHAALYLVAQGSKEIILGREVYRCDATHYVATPIDLPVSGRIVSATSEKPFLCLKINFNPLVLNEVAAMIEKNFSKEKEQEMPLRALFVGKTNQYMSEAIHRLGKLFEFPEDLSALGPLIIKEIFYHLLKGKEGAALRQVVRSGSKMYKISQAIYTLRSELSDEIDASILAKKANMSRSAFFKHFKEITAMSPIQYQKRLRLLEARRLMIFEGETAEGSAYKVGYNSASQFSREYSRMFGNSPSRDVRKTKKKDRLNLLGIDP